MSAEPDPLRVHAAREAVLSVAGEVEERVDDERHVARLRRDGGNRRSARRAEAGEWERGGRHDVAVTRQVRGEECRLGVVATKSVPEDDEREGPAIAREGRVRT